MGMPGLAAWMRTTTTASILLSILLGPAVVDAAPKRKQRKSKAPIARKLPKKGEWMPPRTGHPLDVVLSKSAVVMEETTGKVLWSRDKDTPRYPASTTKILTTLLFLEKTQPDEIVVAPPEIETIGESSMHLKPGERVRAKYLAYAMMLRSANDGCYAAANHVAGSVPKFVELMNARAKEIGCTNTDFYNTNGLNDNRHKTSAYDLALMGREAMKNETFREIVKTRKKKIARSTNTKDLWMVSRNKILWKDPTADGIKTGWTIPAGHTYVGSAMRGPMRVITSLLDDRSWQDSHLAMIDWAFKTYRKERFKSAGVIAKSDLGPGAEKLDGVLLIDRDVFVVVPIKRPKVTTRFEPSSTIPDGFTVPEGTTYVGDWVVADSEKFEQRIPVTQRKTGLFGPKIDPDTGKPIPGSGGPNGVGIGFGIVALGLGGLSYAMRNRARKF